MIMCADVLRPRGFQHFFAPPASGQFGPGIFNALHTGPQFFIGMWILPPHVAAVAFHFFTRCSNALRSENIWLASFLYGSIKNPLE